MLEIDKQLIFEMGYNSGFKEGIKGSIPKDQYEQRLKADLIAMLIELRSEIENYPMPQREPDYMWGFSDSRGEILDYVLEPKINALKENEDANDS